jgi:hypothetical protein
MWGPFPAGINDMSPAPFMQWLGAAHWLPAQRLPIRCTQPLHKGPPTLGNTVFLLPSHPPPFPCLRQGGRCPKPLPRPHPLDFPGASVACRRAGAHQTITKFLYSTSLRCQDLCRRYEQPMSPASDHHSPVIRCTPRIALTARVHVKRGVRHIHVHGGKEPPPTLVSGTIGARDVASRTYCCRLAKRTR